MGAHVDAGLAVPARSRIGGGGSLEWGLWYNEMNCMEYKGLANRCCLLRNTNLPTALNVLRFIPAKHFMQPSGPRYLPEGQT